MSDIFISYAHEDRPRAEAIAQALEHHGWSAWWDWHIPAGRTFRQVIQENLDNARCVIVLWSATSIGSDWVIEEATEGRKRRVLVPILIENIQPPLGLRSIQAADLISWQRDTNAPAFRRLCSDIERLIGVPTMAATAAKQQPASPVPRQSGAQINPKNGLSYVFIAPGEFWMGATPGDTEAYPPEKPRHRVRITKGFWLSATLVTVAAYKRFVGERPDFKLPDAPGFNPNWSKEDHPIVRVTWDEAKAYCEWAGGSLPTEAQWEYAARGGKDGLKYPWGDETAPENANYSGSQWKGTSPVRSYSANAWGLYDMAGNVLEWASDWYDKDYYASLPSDKPMDDPRGPQSGTMRVLRGGSFSHDTRFLRAAYRNRNEPDYRYNNIGFRCVREVVP
jgi:formylglycine-generating enzyme required for sulfatase activity